VTERVDAAFVPLVDCAVLVAAREQGFAAAQGIELTLVREPSWASLRDHLLLGHVDCAHALAPLPIASTLGVGHVQVSCVVPFVLSRGGNAITVSTRLFEEMSGAADVRGVDDPAAAGAALAAVLRMHRAPLTLGMVFPFSSHNFDLRYWLAAAGIHPDRDVRLVSIPPPLMVESLRAGHIDGFCVGEPWGSLAVARGIGRIVATKSRLMPHGVEKVLAVRAGYEAREDTFSALLHALSAAAAWADAPANRSTLAAMLARQEYLAMSPELIEPALDGRLELGGGVTASDPDFVYFHRRAANVPSATDAALIYAQMLRWGQLAPSAELENRAEQVFRADLYMRHVQAGAAPPPHAPAFDGAQFEGDVARYLAGFAVRTPFAEPAGTSVL
jgi:ABC-type nitrate/sulfonate/bicarbonate transport system substrate-binding protein